MINGQILKNAIISGANNITMQKASIDALNIFPVPDGDTGTNMSMTINAAVSKLNKTNSDNASDIANTTAKALLRGARGNSGVILSLIFRGFAKSLEGKENANGRDLANALNIGVKSAYSAVMKPTEGTILTVARVAAEKAMEYSENNDDVVEVWSVICVTAYETLETTPDLLPVLKKAGVVDAGGQGLCTIFDGMMSVFRDNVIIENTNTVNSVAVEQVSSDDYTSVISQYDEVINFTYCTEFIVDIQNDINKDVNELRPKLEAMGDCVVIVDDEEIIKVHVHTDNPGTALQYGLEYGQLVTVKVENMREQNKVIVEDNSDNKKEKLEVAPVTEDFGFVAVGAGAGIENLFKELGCKYVVSGGQSMNPSTEDILEAVLATGAKTVFVLPNNKNIIMAAQQVMPLVSDRKVIVIETKTIPQGITAMLSFDPEMSEESNAQLMIEAAKGVSTGQVTFAARNSEFGNTKIKEGEIIALENGKLTITEKDDPIKAAYKLVKSMVNKSTSFITLIYGNDITVEQAEQLFKQVNNKYGSAIEVTLIQGEQPVYYFIISVE